MIDYSSDGAISAKLLRNFGSRNTFVERCKIRNTDKTDFHWFIIVNQCAIFNKKDFGNYAYLREVFARSSN